MCGRVLHKAGFFGEEWLRQRDAAVISTAQKSHLLYCFAAVHVRYCSSLR